MGQFQLHLRPHLAAKTIALYTQYVRRFATWLQQEHPGLGAIEVTPTDEKKQERQTFLNPTVEPIFVLRRTRRATRSFFALMLPNLLLAHGSYLWSPYIPSV